MLELGMRRGSTICSFAAAAAILVAGCSGESDATPVARVGTSSGSIEVDAATQELARIEDEALAGDQRSAAHLQAIYFKTDEALYLHWLEIGAENGDPAAQYNFAFELWEHGKASEQEKIRSKFWLARAASEGDAKSAATLKRLNEGGAW
ncbi:MAG: hypothetical protein K0M64_02290 [Rhizobium sp.]|nr:hypothetical protein [Rhizobium sp.]